MSGGPLYDIVKQDSRNAAWLGNAIGWQGLEDEANHNVQNPGRALTKAAISAATWYLGSAAGSALGGGAQAAAPTAQAASDMASGVTPQMMDTALSANSALGGTFGAATTDQLAQQAIQMAGAGGNVAAPEVAKMALADIPSQLSPAVSPGLANSLQAGPLTPSGSLLSNVPSTAMGGLDPETQAGLGGMPVSQSGIGYGTFGQQLQGAMNNPSSLMSSNGLPANMVRNLLSRGSGFQSTANPKATALMMNMGSKMMGPPQQSPPPQSPRPMGSPMDNQPLASPMNYQGPFGTSAGNSLGTSLQPMGSFMGAQPPSMGLDPAMLMRLRSMGYPI